MNGARDGALGRSAGWLLAAGAALTLALYLLPYGRVLGWPLVLLATLVHELGHGVAAILAGGRFERLMLWSDGSGAAHYAGHFGRLGTAFVAAGGLLGPAVAAAVGLAASRSPRLARGGLLLFGVALLAAELLVVRSLFGFVFVGVVAAAAIVVGGWARPALAQLALAFVSLQLALSVFSRGDYLFARIAHTAAGPMPSDTAQMAAALLLPYWFWGALCGAVSVAVMVLGLRALLHDAADDAPAAARPSQ